MTPEPRPNPDHDGPVRPRAYREPNCPRCHEHDLDARGLCVHCDVEQLMAILADERAGVTFREQQVRR